MINFADTLTAVAFYVRVVFLGFCFDLFSSRLINYSTVITMGIDCRTVK